VVGLLFLLVVVADARSFALFPASSGVPFLSAGRGGEGVVGLGAGLAGFCWCCCFLWSGVGGLLSLAGLGGEEGECSGVAFGCGCGGADVSLPLAGRGGVVEEGCCWCVFELLPAGLGGEGRWRFGASSTASVGWWSLSVMQVGSVQARSFSTRRWVLEWLGGCGWALSSSSPGDGEGELAAARGRCSFNGQIPVPAPGGLCGVSTSLVGAVGFGCAAGSSSSSPAASRCGRCSAGAGGVVDERKELGRTPL